MGICEFTCTPTSVNDVGIDAIGQRNVLIYCDLIAPQYVGDDSVRLLRTVTFTLSDSGRFNFKNVYYLPVEKRLFQDVRIEIKTLDGEPVPFLASEIPNKIVIHFWRI